MFIPRYVVQVFLSNDQFHDIFKRVVVDPAFSGQQQQHGVFPDTAGVIKKMANGYGATVIRELGEVFADIIIQRQLALFCQQGMAKAVNCLVLEAMSKTEPGVSGTLRSRSAMPKAFL